MNKIKVLITSRDYGAALNTLEISRFLGSDPAFEVFIITSEPAYSYFKNNSVKTDLVSLDTKNKSYTRELVKLADKYIKKYEPDIILTGLSGFNAGIDEAVLLAGKGIPSFTLQDFWGYINHSLKSYADNYLVIDDYAKRLTENKHNQKAIVTGGLAKYRKYNDIIGISENINHKKIVFFGQPLWEYKGYEKTLQFINEVLKKHKIPLIYYKTHPSENEKNFIKLKEIFSGTVKVIINSGKEPVENTLVNSSLAISVNSTVAIDLAYLMKYKNMKIALGVFLLIDEELKDFFYKDFKVKFHPMSLTGVVKEIQSKDKFDKLIKEFLVNENKNLLDKVFKSINENLDYSNNVLENIKNEILYFSRS